MTNFHKFSVKFLMEKKELEEFARNILQDNLKTGLKDGFFCDRFADRNI